MLLLPLMGLPFANGRDINRSKEQIHRKTERLTKWACSTKSEFLENLFGPQRTPRDTKEIKAGPLRSLASFAVRNHFFRSTHLAIPPPYIQPPTLPISRRWCSSPCSHGSGGRPRSSESRVRSNAEYCGRGAGRSSSLIAWGSTTERSPGEA